MKHLLGLEELTAVEITRVLDTAEAFVGVGDRAPGLQIGPGMPRGAVGGANAPPPRNTDNDIWAADLHMLPNGRFLYMSERTGSSIAALTPSWPSDASTMSAPEQARLTNVTAR